MPPCGGPDRVGRRRLAPSAQGAGVTVRLHVHEWGDAAAPAVVCLHGVTSWGGHFAGLATRLAAAGHHVVAPDLLGHGASPHEPPWRIDDHLAALDASVDARPGDMDRPLVRRAARPRARGASTRRPSSGWCSSTRRFCFRRMSRLWAAENARPDRRYDSFEEAIDRRYVESELQRAPRELVEAELRHHLVERDGEWRYRYTQASVVMAYSEMATPPPDFADARVPTLLVLGADSYLSYDHLLDAHRAALGDLLEVVTVPGGHTVLWDALDETAAAIERFLA